MMFLRLLLVMTSFQIKEDEVQLVLTLSENQVPGAVNWLMELIRQGKVLNYDRRTAFFTDNISRGKTPRVVYVHL